MEADFWEKNAAQWALVIQSQSIASRAITNQAILEKILQHQVRSILDVGCGEGWLAPIIMSKGIHYLGIDGSFNLIEIAKRLHGNFFQQSSYDHVVHQEWKPESFFEAALFNFSLLDETITPLLKAILTCLKPNGKVFIQTLHPCFGLNVYQDGWQTEDFKTMKVPFEGTMPWYGRTLGSWIKVFKESDLQVEEIEEPKGSAQPVSILFTLGFISPA